MRILPIILMLAANTSFNGFPRLAAVMAADDWFPHRLSHRGFRLAYSNRWALDTSSLDAI